MARFLAIFCAIGLLAGCAGDPFEDIPRLSDTDVSESDIQAAILSEPEPERDLEVEHAVQPVQPQRGVLQRVFGPPNRDNAVAAIRPDVAEAPLEAPTEAHNQSDLVPADEAAAETPGEDTLQIATDRRADDGAVPMRTGVLGFLRRAAEEAKEPDADNQTQVAALAPHTRSDASPQRRRGREPDPDAPDFQQVSLGTALPYGTLARVCDVRRGQLGTRVAQYPENRSEYALYDSDPGNTALRTFYVTGFKDGCARQFSAALAIFGSTKTHELLRYGLPAQVQPYSQTDAAYEKLKSRICRVKRGEPCGDALPRLSRNTVFVSVYERFGSNPIWKTILIHDGAVIETDIRGN